MKDVLSSEGQVATRQPDSRISEDLIILGYGTRENILTELNVYKPWQLTSV